ncbi:aldehyde dehydrogenase family protein [Actinocorallia sp. A-T 12471]|uniref:aldehyde dehydrogenase family protein n=1 Tax=Actinocorallia sp. A-T 12471 TaxID=3089813 RepID=UPI0029D3E598|nr:aldehyde dehydrogenase family protein [Actinocorallia sp. A-T 12471]MDX6741487.1 aldehyde dehydrogenase family protein [Actinocorallia sp. A-T 12471]
MSEHRMTIDGQSVDADEYFDVVNPATEEVVGRAPRCGPDQLDLALAAARRAADGPWSRDLDQRRAALSRAAKVVEEALGDISTLLTLEQGKPLADSMAELIGAVIWLQHFADLPLPGPEVGGDAGCRTELHRHPLGVVAAITPWNVPVVLACWKIAPALLAGNTVVVKPSPYTPLSTLLLIQRLQAAFPPGVLSVVSGGDELGAALTRHPVPRKITFTGSVATGRKVLEAAAHDLKRVTLELGGNDAGIVLDDADVDAVADALFWGAFYNTGQACVAIKRLYVPERLHDPIVDALAGIAADVVVGDGMQPGVRLGPLNNAPQLNRVTELVDEALAGGASAVVGAEVREDRGFYYPVTLLTGARADMRVVAEEQFGPVLPILPYSDVEEAISSANATSYGLGGSVWGSDTDRAAQIAGRLRCGTAWVNAHMALGPEQPFSGWHDSGYGTENGLLGYHEFTQAQLVRTPKADAPAPW